MKKSPHNNISLIVGLAITVFLCLIWVLIMPSDPMYRWPGILAIVAIVFLAGSINVPVQHMAVLKLLGKRWKIIFYEGRGWIPWLIASIEVVNIKDMVVDVPPIRVLTKTDKVEVIVDAWVWLRVIDAFIYLSLENPTETIRTSTISKCNEAAWSFVKSHTYNQCLSGKQEIQSEIQAVMKVEEERLGVEVTNIDIRPIMPTEEIGEELKEDKKKDLRTKRFAKDLKKIKNEAPELTDNEAANTTQIVEGIVKKEIKEEKKTFKLDAEPGILALVADFLPKKKNGGKK